MLDFSGTDDLRLLAEERILEAEALLAAGLHSGAYYLAGYAVELGLKAVLTRHLSSHALPSKDALIKTLTHRLVDLAKNAGLDPASDSVVAVSWGLVSASWSVEARYRMHAGTDATDMVESAREIYDWLEPRW